MLARLYLNAIIPVFMSAHALTLNSRLSVSMLATTPTLYHFFFSALPAWGHVRSFCILGARLVKENRYAIITILVAPTLLHKAQAEIIAELREEAPQDTWQRIRILSSFQSDSQSLFVLTPLVIETYSAVYGALIRAESVKCAVTGVKYESVCSPNVVILSYFSHRQMLATRAITGHNVPIVSWLTGHALAMIRAHGPENSGGHGDLGAKIEAEAAKKGVTPKEIGDSIYSYTNGTVIKIAGVPDMYDWEYFPQLLPFETTMSDFLKEAYGGLKECDAVITTSTYAFEEVSLDALKSWFSKWNKEVYVIGPLLPSGYGRVADHRGTAEIQMFLDKMLVEHGQKSVILISFGTIFWPKIQAYIEEVIEALIEKDFPFILAYASAFSTVSEELVQKIRVSGLGLISKWFPQQYILGHPATGWFITHCGQNSVMESLGSGIPMICWPFESDQPAAAAHLTHNLKVAFELFEVRTGEKGMKPVLRNGRKAAGTREALGAEIREIIAACRSEKGEMLRKNAEAIRDRFSKAWDADGSSRNEFLAFLRKYDIELA